MSKPIRATSKTFVGILLSISCICGLSLADDAQPIGSASVSSYTDAIELVEA